MSFPKSAFVRSLFGRFIEQSNLIVTYISYSPYSKNSRDPCKYDSFKAVVVPYEGIYDVDGSNRFFDGLPIDDSTDFDRFSLNDKTVLFGKIEYKEDIESPFVAKSRDGSFVYGGEIISGYYISVFLSKIL